MSAFDQHDVNSFLVILKSFGVEKTSLVDEDSYLLESDSNKVKVVFGSGLSVVVNSDTEFNKETKRFELSEKQLLFSVVLPYIESCYDGKRRV
jgi:hypothetical protein